MPKANKSFLSNSQSNNQEAMSSINSPIMFAKDSRNKKTAAELVSYFSISISYLSKSPATPGIENFAFFIRLASGSME